MEIWPFVPGHKWEVTQKINTKSHETETGGSYRELWVSRGVPLGDI